MLSLESPGTSSQLLSVDKEGTAEKEPSVLSGGSQEAAIPPVIPPKKWYQRKKVLIPVVLALALVIFLAVFLPVWFLVARKPSTRTAGGSSSSGGGKGGGGGNVPNPASPSGATTGGNGSTVKLANGTTFTYTNPYGGFWVEDPNDPFNNNAQPNSWTPPLNTSWQWGVDRVYGVNLGGWFVLEPFITPDIFQRYPTAVDEWTLSQAMAADTANGGLQQLENHYSTFITEQDFAEIAGAGLNFVRIPLAFWAIETWSWTTEPFLESVSWKYFVQAIAWARKYGLRICLDLHAVPGSQNGYNHSGRSGFISFMATNMGLANAERTLYYLRVLTEFITQPEYRDVVTVFGIINEPIIETIGMDQLTSFYLQAHTLIRSITGEGAGNGAYIAIHDGFESETIWSGFLQGSDRMILDKHPYFSFSGTVNTEPIDSGVGSTWPTDACSGFGPSMNASRADFGVTVAGEFSASPNDCGLFVLGVGQTSANPECPTYVDWASYNATMKQGIMNFVSASFDSLGDWFFWTWKIAAAQDGTIQSPGWSYQLGVRNGWIPTDPRSATGYCASLGVAPYPWDGSFLPWQTGATTSTIPASSSSSYSWPPPTFSGAVVSMSLMPTYTSTGTITTLSPGSFTSAPASATKGVNGWYDAQDTIGGAVTVSGCVYPDEYTASFAVVPTAPCTGPGSGGGVAAATTGVVAATVSSTTATTATTSTTTTTTSTTAAAALLTTSSTTATVAVITPAPLK